MPIPSFDGSGAARLTSTTCLRQWTRRLNGAASKEPMMPTSRITDAMQLLSRTASGRSMSSSRSSSPTSRPASGS